MSCPKCGSKGPFEETLMGIPEGMKNRNIRTCCSCGFKTKVYIWKDILQKQEDLRKQRDTKKTPICPKCLGRNIFVERRIDGDALCGDCHHKEKWSTWSTYQEEKNVRKMV